MCLIWVYGDRNHTWHNEGLHCPGRDAAFCGYTSNVCRFPNDYVCVLYGFMEIQIILGTMKDYTAQEETPPSVAIRVVFVDFPTITCVSYMGLWR